jgi:hypothetical protein
MLSGCRKTDEEELLSTQKYIDRDRFGSVGCVEYCDQQVCVFGIRCTANHAGGCRRETGCEQVPLILFAQLKETLGNGDWDGHDFSQSYDAQKMLWQYDPKLYVHPDSIKP